MTSTYTELHLYHLPLSLTSSYPSVLAIARVIFFIYTPIPTLLNKYVEILNVCEDSLIASNNL